MKIKAVYVGWYNGLVRYGSELDLIDTLAYSITGKFWRLGGSREQSEIERMRRKLDEGVAREKVVEEIYDFANRGFLYKLPLARLREVVTHHGRKVAGNLDKEVLDKLVKHRTENDGLSLLVIGPTAASEAEVREVLLQTGYSPDTVTMLANSIEKTVDGRLKRLRIDINGRWNRKNFLAAQMRMRDYISPEQTAYIGGAEDDIECFRHIVVSGGRPIISPFAAGHVRAELLKLYGPSILRAPKDGEELETALLG